MKAKQYQLKRKSDELYKYLYVILYLLPKHLFQFAP